MFKHKVLKKNQLLEHIKVNPFYRAKGFSVEFLRTSKSDYFHIHLLNFLSISLLGH
jgi:hypothetical protein